MNIYDITDPKFKKYGAVVQGYDFSELLAAMGQKPITETIEYVASDPSLEALPVFWQFSQGFFGGLPTELGYCMGHNQKLNALEYHRGSEVNIAVTDYLVLLGCQQDLEEHFYYDTKNIEAFYIPAGLAVEFYATTLHYCACHIQEGGYSHATFLPRGTNCPLEKGFIPRTEEDTLLAAKNKWMLVHRDGGFDERLPARLRGDNLQIEELNWREGGRWSER